MSELEETLWNVPIKSTQVIKKYIRDNYISKYKIIEKIQDLKETISRMDIEDIARMLREEQILILEEILEENNND